MEYSLTGITLFLLLVPMPLLIVLSLLSLVKERGNE